MVQTVYLRGQTVAAVLVVPERGMPVIASWNGRGLAADADLSAVAAVTATPRRSNGMDEPAPTAVLLPTSGLGNFQWPALAGHRDGRDFVLEFRDWAVDQPDERTLTLTGTDPVARLSLAVAMAIKTDDVVTMRSRLTNDGSEAYTLDRLMAASVLSEAGDTLLTYEGLWAREFQLREEALGSALWLKENRRGRTSHDRFPAVVLGGPGLADGAGPCLGVHLGWSGNHVIAVDRLDDGRRLVHAGELFEPGEVRLAPGESYESPRAHICHASSLDTMSQAFHAHVRRHVLQWPGGTMRPRPVTLSTWESSYFDHDVEALKRQASAAAELGVERFVLDDGWFKGRDDDTTSLGDWVVDPRKYPEGLAPLADHVVALGMAFGLWFEPEMVNPASDLYRAHPDWALQVKGRPLMLSRHQLALDLTRPQVSDFLFGAMEAVLASVPVSFIKWDMNRDLTAAAGADGRPAASRQTRAAYALMDRIRAAFPVIEIESCSSGAGRADYGVLSRAQRIWASDNTDAVERQEIQRGASLFLPPEILGTHVSSSPNHLTGRQLSIGFRAITALTGHLGLEIDPLALTPAESAELAAYIALHKRLRPLLHGGLSFRHPVRQGRHVYGVIAPDRSHAVLIVAQTRLRIAEQPGRLTIAGLDPAARYRLSLPAPQQPRSGPAGLALSGETAFSGEVLDKIGVTMPGLPPETAVLIEIVRA